MSMIQLVQSRQKSTEFTVNNAHEGETRFDITPSRLERLVELTNQYQGLIRRHRGRGLNARLGEVGKALFLWLKDVGGDWWRPLVTGSGAELIWCFSDHIDQESRRITQILIHAPWEILANESGECFLRQINNQFSVIRKVPGNGVLRAPSDYRLNLLFMAAAPLDQVELDYRAEEVAIETAAGDAGIDVTVDETGALVSLEQTLSYTKSRMGGEMDVLHLSCHGGRKDSMPCIFWED